MVGTMFTVKSSNMIINDEISVKYNGSSLLDKKDGTNAILFILLVPDKGVVKIDCYYNTLDRKRIINYFKKYFNYNCYYILSISGDPQYMFTKTDIKFIKNILGSNFIEILNKNNSWILSGTKHGDNINNMAELVDQNSITYTFPIDIKKKFDDDDKSDKSDKSDKISRYPSHPLYDLQKHTFIKNTSYISNKFLFIGGNLSDHDAIKIDNSIEIDTIESPYELDIDNVKKYIAIIIWSETEEYVEKWNLCTLMQGVPIFTRFYKKGAIYFEDEITLLNYLTVIKEDPSIGHKIAYENSKKFWEWNSLEWEIEFDCFKKGIPLVKREKNIHYISIIRNIDDLTNVLNIFWNQIFNGNRLINIYTTKYLYSDLIDIINSYNIKIYPSKNITLNTKIYDQIDYLIYLDPNAKYTNDYTKNILHNFDVATHINIIGKGSVNYCFTLDIPLASLCCRSDKESIKTFEKIIKKGAVMDEIYSVDPYEFSVN